jgi:myo-inositol-1-phosphate synthase
MYVRPIVLFRGKGVKVSTPFIKRFGVTEEPRDNIRDYVEREREREKEKEEEEEEETDVLRGSKGDPYQEFRKGEGLENL